MKASATNPKVDVFLGRAEKWQEEMGKLRVLLLGCHLTEELKWGKPCYTFEGTNLVLILAMKEHCALLMTNGALLKDPENILIAPSENTQAARQIRFRSIQEIKKLEKALEGYIQEAIAVEKAGVKVTYKKIDDYELPEELQARLDSDPAFKTAFKGLTPGRQRAYMLHIAGAKQAKTREARVEKCAPRILEGKGMMED
jgi:uncharacterized protein YdeI (YjbR/CyaY-like superfamily)